MYLFSASLFLLHEFLAWFFARSSDFELFLDHWLYNIASFTLGEYFTTVNSPAILLAYAGLSRSQSPILWLDEGGREFVIALHHLIVHGRILLIDGQDGINVSILLVRSSRVWTIGL